MAECAKRKQKKKKHKKDEQHSSFSGAIPQMEQVAEFGDKDILKFLIAAQSDDVETVQQYLEWGMPVDTKCLMFLDTALHKACRTGSLKATRLLLDWGANIHMQTDEGHYTLHVAVKNRQHAIVEVLLECGAYPDTPAVRDRLTPLMLAASMGNAAILRQLIDAGCNLDLQDRTGMCALHHCFNYYQDRLEFALHSLECMKLLVESGANILLKDVKDRYPLTLALEKKNIRVVKYLLAHNADPNNQRLLTYSCRRLTPLAAAVAFGPQSLIPILWQAGACWEPGPVSELRETTPRHVRLAAYPFSQPRTLKEACCKSIRDHLRLCGSVGLKFEDKVEELLIPKPLRTYVLMKEMLSQ